LGHYRLDVSVCFRDDDLFLVAGMAECFEAAVKSRVQEPSA
jgi:hypothetical protein